MFRTRHVAQRFGSAKMVHASSMPSIACGVAIGGCVGAALLMRGRSENSDDLAKLAKRCPKINGQRLPVPVLKVTTKDMEKDVGKTYSMKEDDPFSMKEAAPPTPSFIHTDDPKDRHQHIVKHELDVRGLELERPQTPFQGPMIDKCTFAWVFDNVLTEEQCLQLIETANLKGYVPALQGQSFKTKDRAGADGLVFKPSFRSAYTVMYDAPEVTEWLFKALEPHLRNIPAPDGWRVYHLNSFTRTLCYCHPGQKHGPHFDACMKYPAGKFPADHDYSKVRSYMTIFLYLNDVPLESGGATAFPQPDSDEAEGDVKCNPKLGRVMIFSQNLYHTGSTLKDHMKYVMRSDVMCIPDES